MKRRSHHRKIESRIWIREKVETLGMTGYLAGEEITQQGITSIDTTLAPLRMSPMTSATRRPRGVILLTKGLTGTMFTTAVTAAPEEVLIPMREANGGGRCLVSGRGRPCLLKGVAMSPKDLVGSVTSDGWGSSTQPRCSSPASASYSGHSKKASGGGGPAQGIEVGTGFGEAALKPTVVDGGVVGSTFKSCPPFGVPFADNRQCSADPFNYTEGLLTGSSQRRRICKKNLIFFLD